jgi:hypothetical protein
MPRHVACFPGESQQCSHLYENETATCDLACPNHSGGYDPPATRSELFTPFQPLIHFPCIVRTERVHCRGNRPFQEPGYSSHHIASG